MKLKETDAQRLSDLLKSMIVYQEWTLKQAAEAADTSPQHLYRLLHGQTNPTLSRLLHISRAWGYPGLLADLGDDQ